VALIGGPERGGDEAVWTDQHEAAAGAQECGQPAVEVSDSPEITPGGAVAEHDRQLPRADSLPERMRQDRERIVGGRIDRQQREARAEKVVERNFTTIAIKSTSHHQVPEASMAMGLGVGSWGRGLGGRPTHLWHHYGVAMAMTGHKTRSVFDRYHIVSPADLQTATRRFAEAHGHNFGHRPTPALDGRPVTAENA
jgi:hypothetical protein